MSDYEIYALDPLDLAGFQPQRHQTRTQAAKQLAIEMLREIAAGAHPVCSSCGREFRTKLPPALIVLTPKDPLETTAAAFGRVLPGMTIEAVQ